MKTKTKTGVKNISLYLRQLHRGDIRNDLDVQRLSGQWNNEMVNELIYTILEGDFVPHILLGEENLSGNTCQLWVIDGIQRSTTIDRFRNGNYKITSAISNPIVTYQVKDEEGNVTEEEFDVRGKTFNDLPKELQESFDDYELNYVTHLNCDMNKINQYVRRYNNHQSMNNSQKAITHLDKYAGKIRSVVNKNDFFKNNYTLKDRKNGNVERIVTESVMCMFHLNSWNKQLKKISAFLNSNSTEEEFCEFEDCVQLLENVSLENVKTFFSTKESMSTFAVLKTFKNKYYDGKNIDLFVKFLEGLKSELKDIEVNGKTFSNVDSSSDTKNKKILTERISIMNYLLEKFCGVEKNDVCENKTSVTIVENNSMVSTEDNKKQVVIDSSNGKESTMHFLQRVVNSNVTEADLKTFEEKLYDLEVEVEETSTLLEKENHNSLIGIVSYMVSNNIDEELFIDWFVRFFTLHNNYFSDQKKQYEYMERSLKGDIELNSIKAC